MSIDRPGLFLVGGGTPAPGHPTPGPSLGQVMTGLALDGFAVQTVRILQRAGIHAILLKGPVTSRRLYPEDPARRPYTDVDLLVAPWAFESAELLLRNHQYGWGLRGVRDGEFPWYESAWTAPGRPDLHLDLHRGFAGVRDPERFFTELWRSRTTLSVAGVDVPVPSLGGTALILLLHAVSPGRSSKPAADLRRAAEVLDSDAWVQARALARMVDAREAVAAAADLLPAGSLPVDLTGPDVPIAAHQWLGGRQNRRMGVNLAVALAQPGRFGPVRHVVRRVFPSPAFVRLWDERARNGTAALALAYGQRLVRTVAQAPRAVSDVVSARRAGAVFLLPVGPPAPEGASAPPPSAGEITRPRPAHPARAAALRSPATGVRTLRWAVRAHRQVRGHLAGDQLAAVDLPSPPDTSPGSRHLVAAALRLRTATCLQRCVVLQRFDAAAGLDRAVVIGVTAPGADFRAHAWLEGEPAGGGFTELHRRPVPPGWSRQA